MAHATSIETPVLLRDICGCAYSSGSFPTRPRNKERLSRTAKDKITRETNNLRVTHKKGTRNKCASICIHLLPLSAFFTTAFGQSPRGPRLRQLLLQPLPSKFLYKTSLLSGPYLVSSLHVPTPSRHGRQPAVPSHRFPSFLQKKHSQKL